MTAEQRRVLAVAESLANRLGRRIIGIRYGDSWFVAQAVRIAFEQLLALPFEPLQAMEFTLIDLVSETLGKQGARYLIYTGVAANLLLAAYTQFAILIPEYDRRMTGVRADELHDARLRLIWQHNN